MAMIRKLGAGYYGVEITPAPINPEVLEIVSRAFREASLVPRSHVPFVHPNSPGDQGSDKAENEHEN